MWTLLISYSQWLRETSLGHGLKSPPTCPRTSLTSHEHCMYRQLNNSTAHSGHRKNSSINLGMPSAVVIITLWTTCSFCHGQVITLSSPGPNPLSREHVLCSVMMAAELVIPVVGQGYRAILLMCTLCCYHCSIVGMYRSCCKRSA